MNRCHAEYLTKSAYPLISVPRARDTWVGKIYSRNLFLVETKIHVTTLRGEDFGSYLKL